jgi:hypothetical protein
LRQIILDGFHAGNCTSVSSGLPVSYSSQPGNDLE